MQTLMVNIALTNLCCARSSVPSQATTFPDFLDRHYFLFLFVRLHLQFALQLGIEIRYLIDDTNKECSLQKFGASLFSNTLIFHLYLPVFLVFMQKQTNPWIDFMFCGLKLLQACLDLQLFKVLKAVVCFLLRFKKPPKHCIVSATILHLGGSESRQLGQNYPCSKFTREDLAETSEQCPCFSFHKTLCTDNLLLCTAAA